MNNERRMKIYEELILLSPIERQEFPDTGSSIMHCQPFETIVAIMDMMHINDLLRFRMTCRMMRNLFDIAIDVRQRRAYLTPREQSVIMGFAAYRSFNDEADRKQREIMHNYETELYRKLDPPALSDRELDAEAFWYEVERINVVEVVEVSPMAITSC